MVIFFSFKICPCSPFAVILCLSIMVQFLSLKCADLAKYCKSERSALCERKPISQPTLVLPMRLLGHLWNGKEVSGNISPAYVCPRHVAKWFSKLVHSFLACFPESRIAIPFQLVEVELPYLPHWRWSFPTWRWKHLGHSHSSEGEGQLTECIEAPCKIYRFASPLGKSL